MTPTPTPTPTPTAPSPTPPAEGSGRLAAAVAILNERKHRGQEWALGEDPDHPGVYGTHDMTAWFLPLEAIAIAEKLDTTFRQGAGSVPVVDGLEWEPYDEGFILRVPHEMVKIRGWCRRKSNEWEGALSLSAYLLYCKRGPDPDQLKSNILSRLALLLAALGGEVD